MVAALRSSQAKYVTNEIGGIFATKIPQNISNVPWPQLTGALEPDLHLEGPLLRDMMERPIEFFRVLFSNEMVDSIVLHKNSYAYLYVASSSQSTETRLRWKLKCVNGIFKGGSWRDKMGSGIDLIFIW